MQRKHSKSLHVVCMLHAHNMQTCMANVPNPCMLHAKNMPVTCRDLGRISTRVINTNKINIRGSVGQDDPCPSAMSHPIAGVERTNNKQNKVK